MATDNSKITFKGNPLTVLGAPVAVGAALPDFKVTGSDMNDLTRDSFTAKVLIICSVPSVDTPVCATELKRFSNEISTLGDDVTLLTVSMDLPFAQSRFCAAEGTDNVVTGSDYKYRSFGESYGTYLQELGLLARAVFVSDKNGTVTHVEYVGEVAEEPDYDAALSKAKEAI